MKRWKFKAWVKRGDPKTIYLDPSEKEKRIGDKDVLQAKDIEWMYNGDNLLNASLVIETSGEKILRIIRNRKGDKIGRPYCFKCGYTKRLSLHNEEIVCEKCHKEVQNA